jgi:hypothetical protein
MVATPIDDLLANVRMSLRVEKWERFPSGHALLQDRPWTDQALRETLSQLLAEVVAEDRAQGRDGRESNYFEFHDSGLAGILELVEARLARTAKSVT